MTLIISAVTEKGVWQLSDRRLTIGKQVKSDSATKTVRLDTRDGKSLVGYSGIGAVNDNETSEWIKRLFRGQRMSYTEARNLLAARATKRISTHLKGVHEFSIVSIVNDEPKLEIIALDRTGKFWRRSSNHAGNFGVWSPSQRISYCVHFSGSGNYALTREDKRIVVRIMKRKKHTTEEIESALVSLHRKAHYKLVEKSISFDCICSYIDMQGGGWSHLHTSSDRSAITIPTIMNGFPADDIANVVSSIVMPDLIMAHKTFSKPRIEIGKINHGLRGVEMSPDDNLPFK